jgi:hypothetical protein
MAPKAPVIPTFPTLNWSYENGLYCLPETDADKLLDYGENALPLFAHLLDLYTRQMLAILESMRDP